MNSTPFPASAEAAVPAVERVENPRRMLLARKASMIRQHEMAKGKLEFARVAMARDRVLGEGAFGIVDLVVVDTPKGQLLCVRKKLLKQSDTNNGDPELEVELMEACINCDFVVQLWSHVIGLYDYTLLLEYCPYGTMQCLLNVVCDLRSRSGVGCFDFVTDTLLHLNRQAGLSEDEARFYIGCVVLGLEAMHERGVMHRDLKPDNCLIAENRYIKVADLGLAKCLGSEGKRAYSKAGTPGYMAPEVFHGEGKVTGGYSFPADIWSLGVMLWEMVDGALPKWAFGSWYWTRLHFPEAFSQDLRSLLQRLLDKSPLERMALSEIKTHAWFQGFDWEALSSQTLAAPCPLELKHVHIHVGLMPAHLIPAVLPGAS